MAEAKAETANKKKRIKDEIQFIPSRIDEAERSKPNTVDSYRDWETDRKSTRLNSSHRSLSRMPSSA